MAVSSGMAAFFVRPPAAAHGRAAGQPDYIDAQPAAAAEEETPQQQPSRAQARRFGVLTEDKARRLRMQMMETENYHDAMYHSAIASRLASTAPDKS